MLSLIGCLCSGGWWEARRGVGMLLVFSPPRDHQPPSAGKVTPRVGQVSSSEDTGDQRSECRHRSWKPLDFINKIPSSCSYWIHRIIEKLITARVYCELFIMELAAELQCTGHASSNMKVWLIYPNEQLPSFESVIYWNVRKRRG